MSILDSIRKQFRSVIEWDNPSPESLFHLWSLDADEIKNASKLIVGPGQGCIFVYEGTVRAVFIRPIITDLNTGNIPFWTTISKFMQSFQSQHKVGIFFFKTTRILNQKWGTSSVIKYEDPVYKFPVGLMAYGNYSFRITRPREFFMNVVGMQPEYTTEQFREIMVSRIIQPLTDVFAEEKLSYLHIDAKREEIAGRIAEKLKKEFEDLGFELLDFRVEGTGFDEPTMGRISSIADMSADLKAASISGLSFQQVQQIEAMRDAARNEGGAAGVGMSMGAGMGFGKMMAGVSETTDKRDNTDINDNVKTRLQKLKDLYDSSLISEQEFREKKQKILSEL